ncbi:MAG: alanine racemase C-terminal domain-containing protein [Enterocloster clostridioformis]
MVTLRGKRVPVIGVICMDQCMIDTTDVPDAQIGTRLSYTATEQETRWT